MRRTDGRNRSSDQKEERFDVLVPREALRGDRILVKVVDQYNNEQTAAVTVGAAPKR